MAQGRAHARLKHTPIVPSHAIMCMGATRSPLSASLWRAVSQGWPGGYAVSVAIFQDAASTLVKVIFAVLVLSRLTRVGLRGRLAKAKSEAGTFASVKEVSFILAYVSIVGFVSIPLLMVAACQWNFQRKLLRAASVMLAESAWHDMGGTRPIGYFQ